MPIYEIPNSGNVSFNINPLKFRKTWDSSTTYNLNDLVIYNNVSYYALRTNFNKTPDSNTLDWANFIPGYPVTSTERITRSVSSGSLANNTHARTTVSLAREYVVYRISADLPCRVRLYQTAAQQLSDVNRDELTPPSGESGVVLDVALTSDNLVYDLAPLAFGASLEATPSANIPITITNKVGVTTTINVTITALNLSNVTSSGGTQSGETNTASNVGTGGIGLFRQKTGVNLEFKNLNSASNKISVTNDTANNEVDIDVVEANLIHDNIGGTLGLAKGGTGAITASGARTNLSVYSTTEVDNLVSGKANTVHTHAATDITSGTFDILRLPVATSGTSSTTQVVRADDLRLSNSRTPVAHTHATTDITSGIFDIARIPVATNGVSSATAVVRADDTRLSDARVPTAHTHTSANITDFAEAVDDRVGALLIAGTNITLSYNDAGNTLTINSTASGGTTYTDEQAQDAVGTILTDSSSIDFTYNDAANTITAATIFGTTAGTVCQGNDARLSDARTPTAHTHTTADITNFNEGVDDRVGALIVGGTNVLVNYDDAGNTLTISSTAGIITKDSNTLEITNTTTETNLISFTLAANALGTDKIMHIGILGDLLNNTGAAAGVGLFSLKVDGTVIFADSTPAEGTSAIRRTIALDVYVAAKGNNAQYIYIEYKRSATGNITTGTFASGELGTSGAGAYVTGTSTIDTTAARLIEVSITPATANANLSFRRQYIYAEVT